MTLKKSAAAALACLVLGLPAPGWSAGILERELGGAGKGVLWNGPYPAGAKVDLGLAYGHLPRQKIDLYVPEGPGPFPVVAMIHGGGWKRGDRRAKGVVEHKVGAWLPKGVAVASIGYEFIPEFDPREQAKEAARAMAWLQSRSGAYRLDMSRAAVMGHSAGAHLALMLGSDPSLLAQAGFKGAPLAIVSLDSGAVDVEKKMMERHFSLYDEAFGSDPARWRAASPMALLSGKPPATLLVCSAQRKDSCPEGERYAAKAAGLGQPLARVQAEPKGHGAINLDVGADADYTRRIESFLAKAGLSEMAR